MLYMGLPLQKTWKLQVVQNAVALAMIGCFSIPIVPQAALFASELPDALQGAVINYKVLHGLGPYYLRKPISHDGPPISLGRVGVPSVK